MEKEKLIKPENINTPKYPAWRNRLRDDIFESRKQVTYKISKAEQAYASEITSVLDRCKTLLDEFESLGSDYNSQENELRKIKLVTPLSRESIEKTLKEGGWKEAVGSWVKLINKNVCFIEVNDKEIIFNSDMECWPVIPISLLTPAIFEALIGVKLA